MVYIALLPVTVEDQNTLRTSLPSATQSLEVNQLFTSYAEAFATLVRFSCQSTLASPRSVSTKANTRRYVCEHKESQSCPFFAYFKPHPDGVQLRSFKGEHTCFHFTSTARLGIRRKEYIDAEVSCFQQIQKQADQTGCSQPGGHI